MHLYVLAKGVEKHINQWKEDLHAIRLPTYKNGKPIFSGITPDGKPIREYTRLAVRPVQMFELGFPKEELNTVVNSVVAPKDDYLFHDTHHPKLEKYVRWLRKLLGLKEVPRPTNPNNFHQPNPYDKSIMVLPVGLKDDIISPDGKEQL